MITLAQGEVREIGIEVLSQVEQDFTIETADFEIVSTNDNTQIENGTATIDDKKILTMFSATNIGSYNCIFTYRIGPEILKAKVYVEVK